MNEPLPVDKLVAEGVPAPIIQVVEKMAAKQQQDRYQTAEVVGVLTRALAALNLSLPRGYRGGPSSFPPVVPISGGGSLGPVSIVDPARAICRSLRMGKPSCR